MKKIIYPFVCLIILIAINIIASKIFNVEFLEMSFPTGLMSSIFIVFFSSEGGPGTGMADLPVKHLLESETRRNPNFFEFYINTPLIVSIFYTIIAAILSIIAYWKYF
ncbi:hypothetical protein [Faecalimicrobium dakarense]|uniref:hypothetical protein n=1 Tax=Faecalimicrobium dakarense TaxID=1301100 RepID=UPI0004B2C65B|nr:hypothetical protein [[Clostridium] dakarense]